MTINSMAEELRETIVDLQAEVESSLEELNRRS
jgi:hypothetical protein